MAIKLHLNHQFLPSEQSQHVPGYPIEMERLEENPSVLEKMMGSPIQMKAVTSPQILTWATLQVLGSNGGSQDHSEAPKDNRMGNLMCQKIGYKPHCY